MDLLFSLLIALLGHNDFQTREAATLALSHLGRKAELHLEIAAGSKDPEVRHRALNLVIPLRLKWLDAHLKERPTLPWLDSLPLDYPERAAVISNFFQSREPANDRDDEPHRGYRAATRAYLKFLIADGVSRGDVLELLRKMDERCPAWQGNRWTDEP